jgi:hypothetical protein
MNRQARINTWVPVRTKRRISAVARRTGLKDADVIRIGLGIALDQFESGPLEIGSAPRKPERRPSMKPS